ncbi:MAG: hypothetical protein EZS28_040526 [Streblomastix strix]|uniref:Uncharacterized protein n=1 Tax=Streblomastix strix TaxID=222440 RepID=A0A5J4TZS0_9EUKA|nr:MAG: hypothetical protein EZS28_040526 [Streblomastix strix]
MDNKDDSSINTPSTSKTHNSEQSSVLDAIREKIRLRHQRDRDINRGRGSRQFMNRDDDVEQQLMMLAEEEIETQKRLQAVITTLEIENEQLRKETGSRSFEIAQLHKDLEDAKNAAQSSIIANSYGNQQQQMQQDEQLKELQHKCDRYKEQIGALQEALHSSSKEKELLILEVERVERQIEQMHQTENKLKQMYNEIQHFHQDMKRITSLKREREKERVIGDKDRIQQGQLGKGLKDKKKNQDEYEYEYEYVEGDAEDEDGEG